MKTGFSPIDLSKLPAPQVVEELDFEVIFQEMLTGFQERHPDYSSIVESDPVYKALEEVAYREMVLRQDANDKARSVMLAFAIGSDLDHLAALAPVERKVIDPGDPDAEPPISPTYESDDSFRARTQLAPEAFTVAGSKGAYIYHALQIGAVRGASAITPVPGRVEVYVLCHDGSGEADSETINAVHEALTPEEVRPLTDFVTVKSAEIISYEVDAVLYVGDGPSDSVVKDAALSALDEYASRAHALNGIVSVSGIHSALHVEGVVDVKLESPLQIISCTEAQAPYCAAMNIKVVRI